MKVTDPVCGMSIDSGKAAATERHEGQDYHFCSMRCRDTFNAAPARFARKASGGSGAAEGHGNGSGHRP